MRRPRWLALLLLVGCDDPATPADAATDAAATRGPLACRQSADAPADLLPFARLTASATRSPARIALVREDRDGIAAVRDDSADTAWRPPLDAVAAVEIDLAPLGDEPARLRSLAMRSSGTARSVDVDLLDACGGAAVRTLRWSDPTLPLALGDTCARCVQIRLAVEGDFSVAALSLEGVAAAPLPRVTAPAARPSPVARLRASGVVEGFYGVPWSWRERAAMVATLGRAGADTYLYGPKSDPLHRDRWREPYGADALRRFAALRATAAGWGVTFRFGLSPFVDYDPARPADLDAMVEKLRPFAEGPDGAVALLADDIEDAVGRPIDGALGRLHVAALRALLDRLAQGGARPSVWFVPTVYSDEHLARWPGGRDYLRALDQLDPAVTILWTGPLTTNEALAASDFADVRALLGRPPLLWDNWWANDGGDGLFGRIILRPVRGRAVDLPDALAGTVHNPSIQGALSRLAVGTWLAATVDPAAALLERSARAELALRAAEPNPADAALLVELMRCFDGAGDTLPAVEALPSEVAAFVAAWRAPAPGSPTPPALAPLLRRLAALATLPGRLHRSGLDADLVDETVWPLTRVSAEAEAASWSLLRLAEPAGSAGDRELAALAAAALARSQTSRFATGTGLPDLVRWSATAERPANSRRARSVVDATRCVPGAAWPRRWFEGARSTEVFGLGDDGRPRVAGRHRVVALTIDGADGAWGVAIDDVVCAAP